MSTDDNAGAREFKFKIKRRSDGEAWVIWEGDPIKDSEPGNFHVIEHAAYEKLRLERDELQKDMDAHKLVCAQYSELVELRDWQTKAKYEMEQMNNGRPSEWAYSVLRKERDELELALKRADREAASECAELRNECAETHARIHIAQEEHTALRAEVERLKVELEHTLAAASIHADEHRKERERSRKLREALEKCIKAQRKEGVYNCEVLAIAREALAAYDKETGG